MKIPKWDFILAREIGNFRGKLLNKLKMSPPLFVDRVPTVRVKCGGESFKENGQEINIC